MMIKLYSVFAMIAIISGIVTLVRIALGHDTEDAVKPNIVIAGICLAGMITIFYRNRSKIERRN